MLKSISRARVYAAGAAALAFVATFAVSARAVIRDDEEQQKKTYVIVIVESPTSTYTINQRVEVKVSSATPPDTVEIEPGVWGELTNS